MIDIDFNATEAKFSIVSMTISNEHQYRPSASLILASKQVSHVKDQFDYNVRVKNSLDHVHIKRCCLLLTATANKTYRAHSLCT